MTKSNLVKCDIIISWFLKEYTEWIQGNKLKSWARKLGIQLNHNNSLVEKELFRLFLLAILWNSRPTYRVEMGEDVFKRVKHIYTLTKFEEAKNNIKTRNRLLRVAKEIIHIILKGIMNYLTYLYFFPKEEAL